MAERIKTIMPVVDSPGLRAVIFRDFFDFKNSEFYSRTGDIVAAAQKVVPAALNLSENAGRTGITLAVSRRQIGTPIYTIQLGDIPQPDSRYPGGKAEKYAELAGLKVYTLQVYPDFIASSQNSGLPEARKVRNSLGEAVPGGAIEVNGWLIGVSGLPLASMDEAVVLASALGARLDSYDKIESLALKPEVNCKTFLKYEDKLTKPLLG